WVAVRGARDIHATPEGANQWIKVFAWYFDRGSIEILWLLSLPLTMAAMRHHPHRRVFLVGFPAALLLTFLDPLWFDPIARSLTSYHTYFRLFWLLPVAVGMAALVTMLARGITLARPTRRPVAAPLALVLVACAVLALMPG